MKIFRSNLGNILKFLERLCTGFFKVTKFKKKQKFNFCELLLTESSNFEPSFQGNPAGTVYSSSAAKSATTSSLAQEAANSNSSTPADAETIRNKRLTRFMQTAPSSVNNFVTAATSAISNHFDGDFSCNDSRDSVTSASSVISLDNDSLHFGETYSSEEERQIQQAIRMSLEDTNH